jgi:hypothetical protein
MQSPGNDSPVPNDQPWKLLGVFNVEVGQTLTVKLCYDTWNQDHSFNGEMGLNPEGVLPDGMLCVSDVMIHPLWATVDIQQTGVTVPSQALASPAAASDYVDWYDACNPASIPVEGSGSRTEFTVSATVDPLFAQAPAWTGTDPGPWNWTAEMPAILDANSQPEVYFWNDATSNTPWQQDQPIADGSTYTSNVWASINPDSLLAAEVPPYQTMLCQFQAAAPPGGAFVPKWLPFVPPGTHKEVFAFEGFCGWPTNTLVTGAKVNWTEGSSDPPPTDAQGQQVMLRGSVNVAGLPLAPGSPSQVINYWYAPAIAGATPGTATPANPAGNVAWHYYSNDYVKQAEKQIVNIAKQNHGGEYDTITILGWSYGGEAALEVASLLKADGIQVDLAITCDPVPMVPVIPPFPYSLGGVMPTAKPANVTDWYNFYQQFDTDSLRALNWFHIKPGIPTRVRGRSVTGADNTEFIQPPPNNAPALPGQVIVPPGFAPATAHVGIPTLGLVTRTITAAIRLLPPSRKSFAYTPPKAP